MVVLPILTFYWLGDVLANAYTANKIAVWILLGFAMLEVYGEVLQRRRN